MSKDLAPSSSGFVVATQFYADLIAAGATIEDLEVIGPLATADDALDSIRDNYSGDRQTAMWKAGSGLAISATAFIGDMTVLAQHSIFTTPEMAGLSGIGAVVVAGAIAAKYFFTKATMIQRKSNKVQEAIRRTRP